MRRWLLPPLPGRRCAEEDVIDDEPGGRHGPRWRPTRRANAGRNLRCITSPAVGLRVNVLSQLQLNVRKRSPGVLSVAPGPLGCADRAWYR